MQRSCAMAASDGGHRRFKKPPRHRRGGFLMHQGPAVRNLPEHRAREPVVQAGDFADHHRPALGADGVCHIRPEVAKLATYATLVTIEKCSLRTAPRLS